MSVLGRFGLRFTPCLLATLLCTAGTETADCIVLSPLTSGLAGFQSGWDPVSLWTQRGIWKSRQKEKTRHFSASSGNPRGSCIFSSLIVSGPVKTGPLGNQASGKKTCQQTIPRRQYKWLPFRPGSPRHRLWDKNWSTTDLFGKSKMGKGRNQKRAHD